MSPKSVVAIREIGVARAVDHVGRDPESPRTRRSEPREVRAAATLHQARALCEVRASHENLDEPRELVNAVRPVCVEGNHNVSLRSCEAAEKGIPFATSWLAEDSGIRPLRPGYVHGAISGAAINDDHLVVSGDQGQELRKAIDLIERGDDDGDRWMVDRLRPHGGGIVRGGPSQNLRQSHPWSVAVRAVIPCSHLDRADRTGRTPGSCRARYRPNRKRRSSPFPKLPLSPKYVTHSPTTQKGDAESHCS